MKSLSLKKQFNCCGQPREDYVELHNAAYTVASESIGIPLMQWLGAINVTAMGCDAYINITKQRKFKRHSRIRFGNRLFMPDEVFSNDLEHYYI